MFDGKQYGEEIVGLVRSFVEREFAPLKAEVEDLRARIKALEDRPAPEVIKGDPGEPGQPGENGRDGRDGTDGKDAPGFVDVLKDGGELVLTLQDGRLLRTGIRDGEKGADGKDGFSLEAFDVDRGTDGRTYILKFDGGDTRHEYELTFPVPVYCGVFKEGDDYVPGDMVTWGGSLWHCDAETKDKPGTDAWTLAVKKGRDGKDAKPNG